jgi:Nif-specific regulatory protein
MLRLAPVSASPNVSEGELKLELLLDLGAMIAREVELDELLTTFGERVALAMRADRATLWLLDANTGDLRSRVANLPELDELRLKMGQGVAGYVAREGVAVNIRDATTDDRWNSEVDQRTGYQTRSVLCVPIVETSGRLRGAVQVLNKNEGEFTQRDLTCLTTLAEQIARALDYTTLRGADAPRGVPMRGPFNHIVGASKAMESVYHKVLRAAGTDATVLLHGETGTGKGLFARAIHVNSTRRNGPLVHVDCTNLPASLVESELFGHERGAYTGADQRVIGKVEAANGGTLFLDELGELPLELQGKLLRFLQDRQFERVGGRETLEADVRIVTATNRDLEAQVRNGQFRSDLYYRIKVVAIELPRLRDRGAEDILSLAEHFINRHCRRYKKEPVQLSDGAREALVAHTWPGNVRELEHALERAVVLSGGELIEADVLALSATPSGNHPLTAGAAPSPAVDGLVLPDGLALDEATRRYAVAAVERNGGNRSAAARDLGIGRNRLARLLKDSDD